jgi:hypothetical protein
MFKMGGWATITCAYRPAIAIDVNVIPTGIDHRLDGDRHAALQQHSGAGFTEVRHGRFLMKRTTDTVTDQIAYNGEAGLFDVPLYG